MSAVITLPPGVELCHLPTRLELARGGVLAGAVLACQRQGPRSAPTVVALGGISAGRHASEWWAGFVGPGCAIDTERFQVLSIDWIGGGGCSTAPGRGESFPFVATEDQADALAHALSTLRIDRVHALIGSSYGGMVGLQFAARHGDRLDRLCAIAAADRSHAQASAWRSVQRGIIALGQRSGDKSGALALARSLAMTTYRSPGELAERFGAPPEFRDGAPRFAVEPWLEARGADFAQRFTPEQFLCLNASIDAHVVDAAAVRVPTTLVAFDSDQLVPVGDVRRLAAALPDLRRLVEIASRYGHDGFLKEPDALRPVLREVLS